MDLNEVFAKWKELADRDTYEIMKTEVLAFVDEAKEAGATLAELTRRKDQILHLWSPRNWKEAQQEHPHWKEKSWYEERRGWLINCIGRAIKNAYADELKAPKQQQSVQKPKVSAPQQVAKKPPQLKVVGQSFLDDIVSEVEEEFPGFEIFTTHKQVVDHTKEYLAKQKRELSK